MIRSEPFVTESIIIVKKKETIIVSSRDRVTPLTPSLACDTISDKINRLPEECISHVISLTTPRDACVASAVSRNFRSAADSDATWHQLLPSDYASYLSQAVDPVEYASKKELYLRLCDHPLIIDGGLMSVQLEKSSGAKIFLISAGKLSIARGDDSRGWSWINDAGSRFKCALLKYVCWLEICGKINSEILTPNTSYTAYLIIKVKEGALGLSNPFQTTRVTLAGTKSEHYACLDNRKWVPLPGADLEKMNDVIIPERRQDGWLEVELGEFYNGDGMDGEVEMSFKEIKGHHGKSGLIVLGIEVRPKH